MFETFSKDFRLATFLGTFEPSLHTTRQLVAVDCRYARVPYFSMGFRTLEMTFQTRKVEFVCRVPTVILTGITKYGVDLENAKLTAHIDYWDNLAGKEVRNGGLMLDAFVLGTNLMSPQSLPLLKSIVGVCGLPGSCLRERTSVTGHLLYQSSTWSRCATYPQLRRRRRSFIVDSIGLPFSHCSQI